MDDRADFLLDWGAAASTDAAADADANLNRHRVADGAPFAGDHENSNSHLDPVSNTLTDRGAFRPLRNTAAGGSSGDFL